MIPPYLADTRVAKLTFFPEGGNLIEGIPAKVAFKALNEKGIYGIKVLEPLLLISISCARSCQR